MSILRTLVTCLTFLLGSWGTVAYGAVVFTTENNGIHDPVFYIDSGDTSDDFIDLEFGQSIDAKLRYDVINDKFTLNRDLDFSGNEIQNVQIENLAAAPTCDASAGGRIYFDTVDQLTYSCDGVSTWNPLENALNVTIEFPVVQARRTTVFNLGTAFADVALDTTDLENDVTTLDHDDTDTDRINIGATAMYQIIYGYTAGGTAVGTHEAHARVRVNDTTVLSGSESVNRNFQQEFSTTSASFLTNLTAGDFISLQLQRDTTVDATQDEIYFSIIKLEGIKGEKGDVGDPGTAGPTTDSETFTIDNDNTGGDLSLIFGNTLDERLTWNNAQGRFDLTDDLAVAGNLTVGGSAETIDTDGGVFFLSGDDLFIADSLGVEGPIYTDDIATKYQFLDIYGCVRGSASAGTVAGGMSPVIRFDSGGNSQMRCVFPVPDDWVNGSDINIETYWSPSDNTSGDVDFDLEYALFAVGETIGTGSFVDTIPGATYETVAISSQLDVYLMTADIPAASIALDDMVNFRLRRTPGDAGDTYGADVNIQMTRITYTGKKLR